MTTDERLKGLLDYLRLEIAKLTRLADSLELHLNVEGIKSRRLSPLGKKIIQEAAKERHAAKRGDFTVADRHRKVKRILQEAARTGTSDYNLALLGVKE